MCVGQECRVAVLGNTVGGGVGRGERVAKDRQVGYQYQSVWLARMELEKETLGVTASRGPRGL